MAALSTYTPLVSYSLASAATSITVTDIPTTYTDLRIVINALAYYASSGTYLTGALQVGSSNTIDTGSNYNSRYMYSDGSTVGSGQQAGTDIRYSLDVMAASTDTGARSTNIIDIMGYSKANNFKTMLIRTNTVQTATATNMLRESVAQWRNSTAAINTIKFTNIDGTNIYAGSTITIYGIANNTAGAKATGGVISSDSSYFYHSFYATDTFTPTQSLSCDYLVIAGGGSGGRDTDSGTGAGGGGAGGYLTSIGGSPLSVTATAYTITVGAGGASQTSARTQGNDGTGSTFSTVTATGGGGGGAYFASSGAGRTGGSGGGAGGQNSAVGGTRTASPVQGNNGGTGTLAGLGPGGGGGGAGSAGANGSGNGGAGGDGLASSLTAGEISITRAGGGGATAYNAAALGGSGGGGAGGAGAVAGTAGAVNTGSGGGAGGTAGTPSPVGSGNSGAGGSGVVIIRYAR
jgi:hypothetical protein